jgi:hypothetical protein
VRLDAGQERDPSHDLRTLVVPFDAGRGARIPFEALFFAHYAVIRDTCRGLPEPGIAVVAVHVPTGRLAGRLWLRARVDRAAVAVVGRHSRADLLLSSDPSLSLRHLALVLHPLRGWDGCDARFSVLDLRTRRAFHDEGGRHLEAVRCDGPALLGCASYALFFLQTGDVTDWPPLAADAWAMLPQRVYLDEREAEPDRWARDAAARRQARRREPSRSCITAIRGPLRSDEALLGDGEKAVGTLDLIGEREVRRLPVGASAVRRGILLGRYARCDSADLFDDPCISRTHLLLLRVGDTLLGIDTASTEGCRIETAGARPRRLAAASVGEGATVILGEDRARVRWRAR